VRYAILSDIHANLQAWKAVLLDIRSRKADRIICLGDIVGYGPNPLEVLKSVHAEADHIALGNHDAVVCGKMDADLFNPAARSAIEWTTSRLGPKAVTFLGTLPLTLAGPHFRCAHGEFSDPAAFNYVLDPDDADASWNAVPDRVLFVGHSHVPAIFVTGASGRTHHVTPQDFVVEDDKRFLVNVGSVGQPRGDGVLATYCIYDDADRTLLWRSVPFDLDAHREAFAAAGLDPGAALFLNMDPRRGHAPIREQLDFSPPSDPGRRARNVVEVSELRSLRRRASLWRAAACATALAACAVAVAAAISLRMARLDRMEIAPPTTPIHAAASVPEMNLLPKLGASLPAANWGIGLASRKSQRAEQAEADGFPALKLYSARRLPMVIRSAPVTAAPGMPLRMECYVRHKDGFDGELALAAVITGGSIQPRRLVASPALRRKDGWLKAQRSFELPAGAEQVEIQIFGDFSGETLVRDVILALRSTQ